MAPERGGPEPAERHAAQKFLTPGASPSHTRSQGHSRRAPGLEGPRAALASALPPPVRARARCSTVASAQMGSDDRAGIKQPGTYPYP
eukprot:2385173-Pyramimonas_sp.AAC.1